MNKCETCAGEVFLPDDLGVAWGACEHCGDWDWCKKIIPPVSTEAELRRKLKKANKENENLRQVIKFQRDALGNLGEQFVKLSTLLKEHDV